ncbi:MAG: hypothetical protein AABM41_05070 [Chloroflexota bacterium]
MKRLIRLLLLASLASSIVIVGPTYAAEATQGTARRSGMDRAACRDLIDSVLRSDTRDDIKQAVRKARDSDCWTELSSSWAQVSAIGVPAVAAAITCGTFQGNFGVGIAGIQVATSRTRIGVCSDGYRFTSIPEPPYCYVTSIPAYFGGAQPPDGWCGYWYHSSARTVMTTGNNFWVSAYAIPWWKRFGWMRFDLRAAPLSAYYLRGFCCY